MVKKPKPSPAKKPPKASASRQLGKHFIKQWRNKRGLSLRQLANRLEIEPGGDLLISHAQLQRIEQSQQPYSQPILEALAIALDCAVTDLLEIDPTKDGEVVDLLRRLDEGKKAEALRYLRFLAAS